MRDGFPKEIHIFIHGQPGGTDTGVSAKLDQVLVALGLLKAQGVKEMATLDELVTAVTEESTVDDSIIALVQQIKAMLDAGGLSAADQAKVDSVFAQITANKTKITDAVVANTPAA